MPGVGDLDVPGPAGPGGWRWVCWRRSTHDGQVHAFPVEDSQCGRWPQAVCAHTVPPAALGPGGAGPRCPECALGVSAPGTGLRRRGIEPTGLPARALALLRRHPRPQPPPNRVPPHGHGHQEPTQRTPEANAVGIRSRHDGHQRTTQRASEGDTASMGGRHSEHQGRTREGRGCAGGGAGSVPGHHRHGRGRGAPAAAAAAERGRPASGDQRTVRAVPARGAPGDRATGPGPVVHPLLPGTRDRRAVGTGPLP